MIRSSARFQNRGLKEALSISENQSGKIGAHFMKNILLPLLTACSLVSTQAALFEYSVSLDGPSEPSPSLGTGSGTVIYDDLNHTLQLQVSFSGLQGTTTQS